MKVKVSQQNKDKQLNIKENISSKVNPNNKTPTNEHDGSKKVLGDRKFGNLICINTSQVQFSAKNILVVPKVMLKCKLSFAIRQYIAPILEYLCRLSRQYTPTLSFLRKKRWKYRGARIELVKYVYQICQRHKLRKKTLHLCVYYMDRFFNEHNIHSEDLLLLYTQACLLIAMKYQQIYPPLLEKWAKENCAQIIDCEARVILFLDFKLAYPSTQHFLQAFLQQMPQFELIGQLITDLALLSGQIYNQEPIKNIIDIATHFNILTITSQVKQKEQYEGKIMHIVVKYPQMWDYLKKVNKTPDLPF